MSSKEWAGFTDEDIQRINSDRQNISSYCNDSSCGMNGLSSTKCKRGPLKIKKLSKAIESEMVSSSLQCPQKNIISNTNSHEWQSKSKIKHAERKLLKCCSENDVKVSSQFESSNGHVSGHLNGKRKEESVLMTDAINTKASTKENEDVIRVHCKNDSETKSSLPPLEAFEQRQKRIEAENARRKALIIKTITDKKKRTQAEVIKLAKVQKELNHLDSLLSSDVSILRDYIEKASMEFSEAEKRYLRAEKEFVESKLLLFEKLQKKEQLTEHLCTIIEQNETRKADKLLELMEQLEMQSENEELQQDRIDPILSNLCTLNDEACHYQVLNVAQSKKENVNYPSKELSHETNKNDVSATNGGEATESSEIMCEETVPGKKDEANV